MKVAIIGFGLQGQSAYRYWSDRGNQITICDSNETITVPFDAKEKLGKDYLNDLDEFDLIVRSPVIHPKAIIEANGPQILRKVTTVTNEFFKVSPTKNIIGITGTKGKGTTTTLVAKMLEAMGFIVHIGGNIGIPPLDLLREDIKSDDWVVLELANFQTIDLNVSPHIAVCLMVVPEHLDWHKTVDEYHEAKQQLFLNQKSDDIAIFYAKSPISTTIASASKGNKIPYYKEPGAIVDGHIISIEGQRVCQTEELKLIGSHNWQNVCAAITAVWQVKKDPEAIRSVAVSFQGLEHRLEVVREVNQVTYFNDSFAATPDAAMAALDAITQPKVMIIGGYERNLPLHHLVSKIRIHDHDIRKVLIIGQSSERLAQELEKAGYKNFSLIKEKDMGTIVKTAQGFAHSGDAVVLSPGFPSFDMFKNFEVRGQEYKEAVNGL